MIEPSWASSIKPDLKKKTNNQMKCTHCSFEDTHNAFVSNDLVV